MPFIRHIESEVPARTVPHRSEVPLQDTWDLRLLYPDDPAWDADFALLQTEYGKISDFRGKIGESALTLRDGLEFEKRIDMRLERLNQYAALRVAEDSSNDASLSREARLDNLRVLVGEAFSFLVPEIQAIPDDLFGRYLADVALSDWLIPLKKLRRLKPHTLSASEERLLALGASAMRGHQETFSQLTNVDMKFGLLRDGSGNERELTQSSFSSFLQQRDGDVRRDAFHSFYGEFRDHQFTLASSLASSLRADVFDARARNYSSAIAAALFADDMPLARLRQFGLVSPRQPFASLPLFRSAQARFGPAGDSSLRHLRSDGRRCPDRHRMERGGGQRCSRALTPLGEEYISILREGLGGGTMVRPL